MFYYRVFDLIFKSDIRFDFLLPAEGNGEYYDVSIEAGEVPTDEVDERPWAFTHNFSWLQNKTCWLIVRDGNKLIYKLKEGMREDYLRSYISGWGMSMVALQRDTLSFHCSAVSDDEGAILICGDSGSGKSTVTAQLLDRGYNLMSDDMAWIYTEKGVASYAAPAFPFTKLCRDAALEKGYSLDELIYIDEDKDKFLVPYKRPYNPNRLPIKGIIMLGKTDGEEVVKSEITGINKFHFMANNLFLRRLLGDQKYSPEIGQLCLDVAALVPMATVFRPAGKNSLNEVMAAVYGFIDSWSTK